MRRISPTNLASLVVLALSAPLAWAQSPSPGPVTNTPATQQPAPDLPDPAEQSPNERNRAAQRPNVRTRDAQRPSGVLPGSTITGNRAPMMPGANGGVLILPGADGVDIEDPESGNGIFVPRGSGVVIIEGAGQAQSQPARTPTPELDKAVRKELQRRANPPATNEQRLDMIVPRTQADRTDQMRDDPIRPGVTAPLDPSTNKNSTK